MLGRVDKSYCSLVRTAGSSKVKPQRNERATILTSGIESTISLQLLSAADEGKPVVVFEELVVTIAPQTDQAGRQASKDRASGTTSP